MQNKGITTFLALQRPSFALELTQKMIKSLFRNIYLRVRANLSKTKVINQKKNFENGQKLSFDLIAYRKMLLFLHISEHRFYQKMKYKMRNRGEGLFSISQLPITSLKLPSIIPLIVSFSIKYRRKRILLQSFVEL